MADSFILTDGTWSQELIYSAGVQTKYRATYGASVQMSAPDVLMHTPDFGESLPVRGIDSDRMAAFNMHLLPDTNWDNIYNSIAAIKRKVDGAHSQALRYWTDGDVSRVVLRVQLDGATNYTDIPVKFGLVDDSGSFYTPVDILNQLARNVGIILTVAPYGEGVAIPLRNDLPSSPHFIEDSNSDGIADGVTNTGGGFGWSTLATGNGGMMGGRYQSCTAFSGASTLSAEFDAVTIAISTSIVAYFICLVDTGFDPARLILQDGAGTIIQSKTLHPADSGGVSSASYTDGDGNTWYKIELSGTNSGAANCSLRWERNASDDTGLGCLLLIDAVYLETGQTAVPNAWCSTSDIENRYDPTSANEERINYLDFWGIPGDSDALVQYTVTHTTTSADAIIISNTADKGDSLIQQIQYWIEDSELSTGASIDWTNQTGTGTSADSYQQLILPSVLDRTAATMTNGDELRKTPLRVFAGVYMTTTNPGLRMQVGATWTDYKTVSTANTWELIDYGIIIPSHADVEYPTSSSLGVTLDSDNASPGTIRVDFIIVIPADNFMTIAPDPSGTIWYVDGKNNNVNNSDRVAWGYLGDIGKLKSGNRSNRLTFFMHTGELFDLTNTMAISGINVTPRTRHLLGTQ